MKTLTQADESTLRAAADILERMGRVCAADELRNIAKEKITPTPDPLPCPLCGSSLLREDGTDTWYHGADRSCHLLGIRITPRTIAAWNRRAPCPQCAEAAAKLAAVTAERDALARRNAEAASLIRRFVGGSAVLAVLEGRDDTTIGGR